MSSPPPNTNVFDFTAENGVPFRSRLVLPGDDFGAFSEQKGWALKAQEGDKPLIEFYDKRHDHGPHGQFVSRYDLGFIQKSLREDPRERGLDLEGGVESWKIDRTNVMLALDWAQSCLENRTANPIDAMTMGYIKAALFMTMDEDDTPLDRHFTTDSVGPQVHTVAKEDCDEFRSENKILVSQALEQPGYSEERLGHDFWMTRNRHGTGFWDRDELAVTPAPSEIAKGETLGDALTQMAQQAKEIDLEIADDGSLSFFPNTRKKPHP